MKSISGRGFVPVPVTPVPFPSLRNRFLDLGCLVDNYG